MRAAFAALLFFLAAAWPPGVLLAQTETPTASATVEASPTVTPTASI